MARYRTLKRELETLLLPPAWPEDARDIPPGAAAVCGMAAVGPLLSFLPRGGLLKWRAVMLLGQLVGTLAETELEDARTVMRRCMWHMNEDSGNMGWGIAEAMGEIAAVSAPLAGEYGRIILSYVRDTGFADNFVDHPPLRRGAFWAIGRFAPVYPAYREEAGELLLAGLADEDAQNRGIAAWGLGKLAAAGAFREGIKWANATEGLGRVRDQDLCEILDGAHCRVEPAAVFALQALLLMAGSRPN